MDTSPRMGVSSSAACAACPRPQAAETPPMAQAKIAADPPPRRSSLMKRESSEFNVEDEDDDENWDGSFASTSLQAVEASTGQTRRDMKEWADNDEDEATWMNALEARVDERLDEMQVREREIEAQNDGKTEIKEERVVATLLPSSRSAAEVVSGAQVVPPKLQRTTTESKEAEVASTKAVGDVMAGNTCGGKSMQTQLRQPNNWRSRGTPIDAKNATGTTTGDASFDDGALSEAERIRRFIMSDVKEMSVERIVRDARRLNFLEEFYQGHHDASK